MASKRPTCTGIDVSADELHVAVGGSSEVAVFDNDPEGHKALVRKLTKRGRRVRVVVEATSTYHLDLCLVLDAHPRIEVMVANPRQTKHFQVAQGIRAKTDGVDAAALREFARRMPFVPWKRPDDPVLELRAICRYIAQLVKRQTRLKNQLHALQTTHTTPSWMVDDLDDQLSDLARRIESARGRALAHAREHDELWEHVLRLDSMTGIGPNTAVRLVAEFLLLDPDMTSKQIAAWAGLDPVPRDSGKVRGKRSISKRGNASVRGMLFMPALAAARAEGPLRDFYLRIEARSGHKRVAQVALMRKMLTIGWALFRRRESWEPNKASPKQVLTEAA